jgi:hypothetical protein
MANDHHCLSTLKEAKTEDEVLHHGLMDNKESSEKGTGSVRDVSGSQVMSGENTVSDEEIVSTGQSDTTPVKRGTIHRIWHWKPSATRYDPNSPPKFTVWLNILFALVSLASKTCSMCRRRSLRPQSGAFTVATLYYNQAILFKIADTFDVSFERASSVATLMQAGYATGLLFICPLGDLFRRRPFILGLVTFTATLVSPETMLIIATGPPDTC